MLYRASEMKRPTKLSIAFVRSEERNCKQCTIRLIFWFEIVILLMNFSHHNSAQCALRFCHIVNIRENVWALTWQVKIIIQEINHSLAMASLNFITG